MRSAAEARTALARLPEDAGFWLLQRYVDAIEAGEKRTVVAGGRRIGTYLRRHEGDFRSNLALGGEASPTVLEAEEARVVDAVAKGLGDADVGFAAIDTAGPWLIEVNVANPGGLGTLASLYGGDPAADAAAAIASRVLPVSGGAARPVPRR